MLEISTKTKGDALESMLEIQFNIAKRQVLDEKYPSYEETSFAHGKRKVLVKGTTFGGNVSSYDISEDMALTKLIRDKSSW